MFFYLSVSAVLSVIILPGVIVKGNVASRCADIRVK